MEEELSLLMQNARKVSAGVVGLSLCLGSHPSPLGVMEGVDCMAHLECLRRDDEAVGSLSLLASLDAGPVHRGHLEL